MKADRIDQPQTWGVYLHSSLTNGYVARPMRNGRALDTYNYGQAQPVKVYKTERGARAYADLLTFGPKEQTA